MTKETRSPDPGLGRLDVEVALGDVTRRLTGRFSPTVPEAVVAATVRESANHWQQARVTDFVPLLVERRSIERLRKLAAAAAAVGGDVTPRTAGFSQVA